jgi:hypothetical protein
LKLQIRILTIWSTMCLQLQGYTQAMKKFNVAFHTGIGVSALPTHSKLYISGNELKEYGGLWYAIGLKGEYTISNTLGLNWGYQLTEQHHEPQKTVTHPFSSQTAGLGNITIVSHQVPILFFYKISPISMPYKYFKISTGTTMNWMAAERMLPAQFKSLWNIVIGLSYGIQNKNGRVMELEIQHLQSFTKYQLHTTASHTSGTFESYLKILSMQFHYYLFRN